MTLQFYEIYILAALSFLVILPNDIPEDSIRGKLVYLAIVELIIAAIVDAIWLKQPFWLGVLAPIALPTFLLAGSAYLPGNSLYEFFFAAKNHFEVNISYNDSSAGLASRSQLFIYRVLAKSMYLCFILLVSSLSFALLRLNPDALVSRLTGGPQDLSMTNSTLFILSILGLLAFNLIFGLMKGMDALREINWRSEKRKEHPLVKRAGYDYRRCGQCHGKGGSFCLICSGTGTVEVKSPSVKCPDCAGSGWHHENNYVRDCYTCKGKGWISA